MAASVSPCEVSVVKGTSVRNPHHLEVGGREGRKTLDLSGSHIDTELY